MKRKVNHKRFIHALQYRPSRILTKLGYFKAMREWDLFVEKTLLSINDQIKEKDLFEISIVRIQVKILVLDSLEERYFNPHTWNEDSFTEKINVLINQHYEIVIEYYIDRDIKKRDLRDIKIALDDLINAKWELSKRSYDGKVEPLKNYVNNVFDRFKERLEINSINSSVTLPVSRNRSNHQDFIIKRSLIDSVYQTCLDHNIIEDNVMYQDFISRWDLNSKPNQPLEFRKGKQLWFCYILANTQITQPQVEKQFGIKQYRQNKKNALESTSIQLVFKNRIHGILKEADIIIDTNY